MTWDEVSAPLPCSRNGRGHPADYRITTDNGLGYRSKLLRSTLEAYGIRYHFTRPNTRRTKGKAERSIRTALDEWTHARPHGH